MPDHRPPDDATIGPDEKLYVRIFPSPDVLRPVEGGFRPHSGAIKRQGEQADDPLSVDLGSICTPEETRDRDTSSPFHVAVFTAGIARGLGLRIVRDPDHQNNNPAHALVYGNRQNAAKTYTGGLKTSEAEKLARLARIVLINEAAPH